MTVTCEEAAGRMGNKFERDGGGSWLDLMTGMKGETRRKDWKPGGLGKMALGDEMTGKPCLVGRMEEGSRTCHNKDGLGEGQVVRWGEGTHFCLSPMWNTLRRAGKQVSGLESQFWEWWISATEGVLGG